MSSVTETYCLCGQQYRPGQFMIECDRCREWFHGGCVHVKAYHSEDIDKYHCPKCAVVHGPSIYKVPTNRHRQDRYELNADRKPTQTGTETFVEDLLRREYPREGYLVMDGRDFTEAYLKEKGFDRPILFESTAGLDLKVPSASTFTVRTVERHCGSDREVDVIDVTRQNNFKMPLGDFVDYFTETERSKVLNVLSLEFSDTPMSALVQPPLMARRLDWVRVVWPSAAPPFTPLVQKYCIMSTTNSYTDFHIDFGGTTVWYHVLHGTKVFYLVPPTDTNLNLYQQWSTSPKQNEVFFGDHVESCTICVLKQGQTLFIPTGWIHAVLTKEDSLVFGGNFLHSHNIELQLHVNEIEKQVETPTMFRFPLFETIHWYAGSYLLQQLRRINEEQQDEDYTLDGPKSDNMNRSSQLLNDLPPYLLSGIKVLTTTLKEWNACKSYDSSKKQNIPDIINSSQLVRDLSRELRRLDKLMTPTSHSGHSPNKKKKKKSRASDMSLPSMNSVNRHFSSVSKEDGLLNANFSSFDSIKPRHLYSGHSDSPKKSLILTLPKPIMHVPDSQHMFSNSSQDSEDAELSNMASIASKSGMATYSHNYDSQDSFGGENDYKIPMDNVNFDHKLKKSYGEHSHSIKGGQKIKSSTSSRHQGPPPDYATTEHSILKSHLVNNTPSGVRQQKSSNHWTISKSQIKNNISDTADEQILFTNENLTMPKALPTNVVMYTTQNVPFDGNGILYGPGMYANEGSQHAIDTAVSDNYNPDFIVDRKTAGLGLPDYSPTKSINEYLGAAKPPFVGAQKAQPGPSNFANNSDPYSQAVRSQEGASPFSDDSSGVPVGEEYRLAHEDGKDVSVVHAKSIPAYSSESYDYIDIDGKRQYVTIDKNTQVRKCSTMYIHKGNLTASDEQILIYNTNVTSHGMMDNMNHPPSYESSVAPRRTERPTRRRNDHRSSIYDYEDQDEIDDGDLYIDEAPAARQSSRRRKKPPIDKMKRHMGNERNPRMPEDFAPKNGIESLLQASAFTGPPPGDNQERDAVAGMLSIGQSYGLARADSSRRLPPVEGPPIRAVHKDDDYVYPSLELSSDDDDDDETSPTRASRSKRRRYPFVTPSGDKSDREDESWWPRARLGRLVPRVNRPTRKGSHRESVQAALRAARLRGNAEESPQVFPEMRHPALQIRTSPPTVVVRPPLDTTNNSPPVIREPSAQPNPKKAHKKKKSVKAFRSTPATTQHVLPSPTAVKAPAKFKKGMKTAKQRLGKILKIHKMMC